MIKQANKYLSISILWLFVFTLLLPYNTPASGNQSVEMIGDPLSPKLTIYKFEDGNYKVNEHGGFQANIDAKPIEGVEFTLTQTHFYDVETDTWKESVNNPSLVGITDSEGKVEFTKGKGLELGRYEIKETAAPDFVLINNQVYSVDIPMTTKNGSTLIYDVHVYVKNEFVLGNLVLEKVNEDGEQLQGVEFALFNTDGSKPFENNIFTTDAEGKITIDHLVKGSYYFIESLTKADYAINREKIYFEVLASGDQTRIEWTPKEGFVTEAGRVINYRLPEVEKDVEGTNHYFIDRDEEYVYHIMIKTPEDIHKYKTLGVTDTLDSRLSFVVDGSINEGWEVSGTERENIKFTQDGQTLKWSVKDLSKLRPNEDLKITFTAKIKLDAELGEDLGIPNEASLNFDNQRGEFSDPKNPPTTPPVYVTPRLGGLKILKVDKHDSTLLLQGAKFQISRDQAGKDIVQADQLNLKVNGRPYTGPLKDLVTTEKGEIFIENLPAGTYYLTETKAPTYRDQEGNVQNYRLLTKPVKFTINSSTEIKELVIKNSKSKWFVPRTGGLGTIIFTAVGIVFIIIALFIFLRAGKENREEQLS